MTERDRPDGPTRRRVLAATAGAALTAGAGCSGLLDRSVERRTEVETFRAAALSTLVVEAATDDVAIERRDTDEVRVRADKRAFGAADPAGTELTTHRHEEQLAVSTTTPTVVGFGGASVDLQITLPSTVTVDRVETADGDIAVRGVTGDVRLRSHDGSVTAHDLAGDVVALTDDGAVTVVGTDGRVVARSRDGGVTVESPGRVDRLETNDGDVVTDIPRVASSATVRSDDGDITARLAPTLDASLRARTRDGDVTVESDVDVRRRTDEMVRGQFGDGTRDLTLLTNDGDIGLRESNRR